MCIRDSPRSASEIHGANQDAGKGKAADQRGGEGRTLSDKIRKYVLPNLPYLFVFWFFSKIGTAYRIAPGTDFGTKLMGMLDTFPKAFETYWPVSYTHLDVYKRQIRLNELVPDLMKLMDEKKLGFTTAVELSYVSKKNQNYIAVAIDSQQSSPSQAQAKRMRCLLYTSIH